MSGGLIALIVFLAMAIVSLFGLLVAIARRPALPLKCVVNDPSIPGGACNGDHREGLHHNDEGFYWGPV